MVRFLSIVLFLFSVSLLGGALFAGESASQIKIPDVFVRIDPGEENKHALVVEKSSQQIFLYEFEDYIKEVARYNCSTGKATGAKVSEGDSKTPEGVYFFILEHPDRYLSPTYGSGAFPIDYPNALDRLTDRNGDEIWLHGTNKKLKPKDPNGCVAVQNHTLNGLKKYIRLNQTPLITTEKLYYVDPDQFIETSKLISDLVFRWNKALQKGPNSVFLRLYHKDSIFDMLWWDQWDQVRKRLRDQSLSIEPEHIFIFRQGNTYVAVFNHFVTGPGERHLIGRKKLFIKSDDMQFKIIAEEYQYPASKNDGNSLLTNCARILSMDKDIRKIETIINQWVRAWSSRDIKKYGALYAQNFKSQKGKELKEWLNYKEKLNRKYDYINISIDKLRIKKDHNNYTATFKQSYKSNSFQSVSSKMLSLVPEHGNWKIYREISR